MQLYAGNLQGLRTEALTILTSNRGASVKLAAVCWQPTGLKDGSLDIKQRCFLSNLQLYVGYPQVIRTEVLTSNRGVFVKIAAVGWQPTGLKDGSLDNLDIKQGCFCEPCSCMGNLQVVRTEILTSNSGVCVKLAAVCWQPTGLKDGSLDNLDIKQGFFSVKLASVCWQPTGLKDGSLDNLDIKQGCFCQTCSCMLATYRAKGRKPWQSWHQTGACLSNLKLYAGNLQGLRTEALTILTSNRGVSVKLAAVCWQPTGLKDGSLDIKQGCFF